MALPAVAASDDPSRFRRSIAVAALVGLAVRLVYAVGFRWDEALRYDGPVYVSRARFLLQGRGFVDPDAWFFHGIRSEGAIHPPGNALVLTLGDLLGLDSPGSFRIWGCLIGTATVVVIGLLGREVFGPRAGVWAATIAAVHPGLWLYDPTVMAETPAQLLTAVLLLLAFRFWRSPSASRAAWMGAVAAAAALTRSELVVLILALVVPVTLAARVTTRRALACTAAALLWFGIVLAPWVGWNLVRYEHPATLATGIDISLRYANCEESWYGDQFAGANVFCGSDITYDPDNELLDETEIGELYRARAGTYVRDNLDRWPVVVAARMGRTLGVVQTSAQMQEGIVEPGVMWANLVVTAGLAVLALVAIARPAPRTRRGMLVLLTPLAAGLAGAAITFGTSRYRAPAEVGLVVLGACGIVVLERAVAARRARREATREDAWADERLPRPVPGAAVDEDDDWELELVPVAGADRPVAREVAVAGEPAVAVPRDDGPLGADGIWTSTAEVEATTALADEDDPDGVSRARGRRAAVQVLAVSVVAVAVLGILAARPEEGAPSSATVETRFDGGTAAPAEEPPTGAGVPGVDPGAVGPGWPSALGGRPMPLGTEGGPEAVPTDASPGAYLWSDFDGWHLWVVNGDGVDGLRGRVTADAELAEVGTVPEGVGVAQVDADAVTFDLPAEPRVSGVEIDLGFFVGTLVVELETGSGPLDPSLVRLGYAAVPATELPLVLIKQPD